MVSPSTAAGTPPLPDSEATGQSPKSAGAREGNPDPWCRYFCSSMSCENTSRIILALGRIWFARAFAESSSHALLAFVGAVAAATFAATAAALMLIGLGQGLGELLGGRMWLGNVLAGAVVLSLVARGGLLAARWLNNSSRLRTIRSYAQRRERQRRQFGRDVWAEPAPAETETEFLATGGRSQGRHGCLAR